MLMKMFMNSREVLSLGDMEGGRRSHVLQKPRAAILFVSPAATIE